MIMLRRHCSLFSVASVKTTLGAIGQFPCGIFKMRPSPKPMHCWQCKKRVFVWSVATVLLLGSCWVGGFDESKVKKILNIPSHFRPVGIQACGYDKKSRVKKYPRVFEDTFTYCK